LRCNVCQFGSVVRVSLFAGALGALVLLPPSASGARRASSPKDERVPATASWAGGVEAVLPANAATTNQNVSIGSVSCPSAGNCSAVGTYVDNSGRTEGLLLTEMAGTWRSGVEAALPANAASTDRSAVVYSVSCPSAGNCTAVGAYRDNSANENSQGLLLSETAGTWSTGVEAALPADASSTSTDAGLVSVSCASAGNCSAVGSYQANASNNTVALLLTETAGSWATGVEAALPADAATSNQLASLGSISCASAGNCTAVGGYFFMSGPDSWASQALMVTETAGTWDTGVEPSLPANALTPNPNAGLSSVSCSSAGNCTAVGSYTDNSPGTGGLLLSQTAGNWGPGVEAALPSNANTQAPGPLYALRSVSCASAGNCSAVGTYFDDSGNGQGLFLNETAGAWARGVEAVAPADAASTGQLVLLTSVSCSSVGNCSAVGGYNVNPVGGEDVLMTETAGTWAPGTEMSLPSNAISPLGVNSVACPSAGSCNAVGSYEVEGEGGSQGVLLGTSTTPPRKTLTVSKSGTGSGTITSSPSGIDCGSTCASGFDIGSEVTLTATPNANSYLVGWSGSFSGNCDNIGPCQVAVNSASTVTADFALKSYVLTVHKSGNGSGNVSSVPAGLDCGPICSSLFDAGTKVTLVATPHSGSKLATWSGGGCSGTGDCHVTIAPNTTLTATFVKQPKCVVPNVKGKTVSAAKRALKSHACTVGKVRRMSSRKIKKGRVISEKPKAGARLRHGAKVNLVVSRGRT
jgi:PASTA domain/Divergent InlB B-repeat domain